MTDATAKNKDADLLTIDSLVNFATGMGTIERDKSVSTFFGSRGELDKIELEAAYTDDWISRKIIDIPAEDATREWRAWQAEPSDITKIEKVERQFFIQRKVRQALQRGRLYGGGALILGVNQGKPEEELIVDRIRIGDLKWIHMVSRHDLTSGPVDWNVDSPYYGEPQYYMRTATGAPSIKLHPSRVVRFLGKEPIDINRANGWGVSVLQSVADAVKSTGTVTNVIAQLVQESKIDVVKIPEMSERIAGSEYEKKLKTRFATAAFLKSTYGVLLIDAAEEWQRVNVTYAGLPDILKMYLMIASGAADIPATRMLSQSPTGMSSTGESDTRNYYDKCANEQKNEITPSLFRLDEILIRSALGTRPEDIFYEWNPLWQMDDAAKAEIAVKKANIMTADVNAGLIDSVVLKEARQNQLIEDGTYPGLELIIEEFDGMGQENDAPEDIVPPEADNENEPATKQNNAKSQVTKDVARRIRDSAPRTLYVRRDVLNGAEIQRWAKSQGFKTTLTPKSMHVTIIYSKTAVDWMKVDGSAWDQDKDGNLTVPPGGPRLVEQFNGGAVVLAFSNSSLSYRHIAIMQDTGASYDFDQYQPHITLTYDLPEGMDISKIEPYRGQIILGPEIFEEIKPFDGSMAIEDNRK